MWKTVLINGLLVLALFASPAPAMANANIDIEKLTNGQDADTAPGPEILVGRPVSWTYVVTNTGGGKLSNVTVTDDQGLAVTCPKNVLEIGEEMTCTANAAATAGQYVNVGTAVGTSPGGSMPQDTDVSHYFGVEVGRQGCTGFVGCGDGRFNISREECDDANMASGDGCNNMCMLEFCGDGSVNNGPPGGPGVEVCDEGGVQTATCEAGCTAPICGDNITNMLASEDCDEGGVQTATCEAGCTAPICGDNITNMLASEDCDEGGVQTATCEVGCTAPICGDNITNMLASEACDEGLANSNTTPDACRENCVEPSCGDGVTDTGEECDDGNGDDGDGCDTSCRILLGDVTILKDVVGTNADPDQDFQIFLNSSDAGQIPVGPILLSENDGGAVFTDLTSILIQIREENIPADWTLNDLTCTSSSGQTNFSYLQNGSEVQFTLAPGDSVVCTFTNEFAAVATCPCAAAYELTVQQYVAIGGDLTGGWNFCAAVEAPGAGITRTRSLDTTGGGSPNVFLIADRIATGNFGCTAAECFQCTACLTTPQGVTSCGQFGNPQLGNYFDPAQHAACVDLQLSICGP